MTRKELNGSFYAKQLIRSYQEQIKELQEKSLSLKSSSSFTGAPSGQSKKAAYTAYIEQIICLEEKLQDAIERQLQAEAKTTEYIEQFNNETEKLLLRLRYIEHMSWSEIADEMNYSERHILRLHREILKRCQ
ncbi:MAG: DUF1492 domain-containing protein [Clostridia bacterium]|nr:DUF1492 domain-containing protein [Clostridia bacterium]